MTMWGWWQWWWQQWNKWWQRWRQCWCQQRCWWWGRSEKRGSTLYPCPNIPAYILYLPPSHSVRILSDSSCIYAAIRSICIGFNDGFVYIFTIHPEQVLYNAIYKILAGDRQCDIQQLTCKNSRKCVISNLYVFESQNWSHHSMTKTAIWTPSSTNNYFVVFFLLCWTVD